MPKRKEAKSPYILKFIGEKPEGRKWTEIHDFLLTLMGLDPNLTEAEAIMRSNHLPVDFGRDGTAGTVPIQYTASPNAKAYRGTNTTLLNGNHDKWGILDVFCDYDPQTRRYKLARKIERPYMRKKICMCKKCGRFHQISLGGKWMPPRLDGRGREFDHPKKLQRKPSMIEQLRANAIRPRIVPPNIAEIP